jgi:hypothetical protein
MARGLAGPAVLVLVCGVCGCGSGPVKVSGVVVWDTGEPVANVRVLANPTKGGADAWADTDAEGKFSLTTFKPRDGAMPGEYKLTVLPGDQIPPQLPVSEEDVLRRAEAGKNPRPKVNLHPNYGNVMRTPLTLVVPPREEVRIVLNKKGT